MSGPKGAVRDQQSVDREKVNQPFHCRRQRSSARLAVRLGVRPVTPPATRFPNL
ncbi:hypothetical protein [Streptomyces sp. MA15]|uniref:hypothetical protein n=1 Tax=Streptomyces sp. MA15 TaxID=3055061 RepID=UPI0025AF0E90|nr:hypothetical protein [Streptomyces sp. MA15]MDN3267206.1 hypothetical protein [Streptomyces sp. MA15]